MFLIVFTIIIGGFFSLFVANNMEVYNSLNKPVLNPPGFIFPIVWTILYVLMGISIYLVSESETNDKKAYMIYIVQLVVNSLWTLIFFGYNNYLLSFIWIILLIALVIFMIIEFFKINKTAAYLQILYLLWLLFASYLNYSIHILN